MTPYCPMTTLPTAAAYTGGDVLVLIGELFGRGYANGLIEEASRLGMTVIGTTVGRRDSDNTLRPLTAEELSEAEQILGASIINIPLEAGFDYESVAGAPSFAEQLKKAKPDEWQQIVCDPTQLEQARLQGTARFKTGLAAVMAELATRVPANANIVFAHTMAGGIPRARFFMPLLNRVFKGSGDKYLPSEPFWNSQVGALLNASFNEVTADTFAYLIEESAPLRARAEAAGAAIRYTAYGYHGTGVLIDGSYRWQSYTPYLQGYAKKRLEEHAIAARNAGIAATVYNCPEILTNSSALFLGVELSLYPLMTAVMTSAAPAAQPLYDRIAALLAAPASVESMLDAVNSYLTNPLINPIAFEGWPQHSSAPQMELMLATSQQLMAMHADQKQLVCAELSRLVFRTTGRLMIQHSWSGSEPVVWLNHDTIATLVADPRGADLLDN